MKTRRARYLSALASAGYDGTPAMLGTAIAIARSISPNAGRDGRGAIARGSDWDLDGEIAGGGTEARMGSRQPRR